MSQRQESLRVRMWAEIHKNEHEKLISGLQTMKAKLDGMDQNSDEYKKLKAEYDSKYKAAEDFFMEFHES